MKRALLSSSLLALTAAFVVVPAYAADKAAKAAAPAPMLMQRSMAKPFPPTAPTS